MKKKEAEKILENIKNFLNNVLMGSNVGKRLAIEENNTLALAYSQASIDVVMDIQAVMNGVDFSKIPETIKDTHNMEVV